MILKHRFNPFRVLSVAKNLQFSAILLNFGLMESFIFKVGEIEGLKCTFLHLP